MWNNIFLYNSTFECDANANGSQSECEAAVGGFFKQQKSTTWTAALDASVLGLPLENAEPSGSRYGTDTLQLNSTYSLPNFPFGFNNGNNNAVGSFGLGQNSSLLNDLYSAGAIPSHTWSLYHGWDGEDSVHQADGSLIFGGYDAAKVFGPNITLPFAANHDFDLGSCPSKHIVTISDIKMNLRNGSSPSILGTNKGAAFRACILPNYNYIALSYDVWSNFLQISRSTQVGRSTSSLSWWQMLIAADGAYDGDLTFSFYPGLDIRIPNHQLITPEYDFDEQGQRYDKNNTNRLTQIYSLEEISKDWMPSFGMGFFSAAYLMVDNDRQQFTLWKGQPSEEQNIVALGASACNTTTPLPGSGLGPAPGGATPRARGNASLSEGAMAGVVIGAIAFLLGCLAGFWLLKRRQRACSQEALLQEAKHSGMDSASNAGYAKPELPDDPDHARFPPIEMPLSSNPSHMLPPYEVPGKGIAYEMLGS
ncbi:MAG: hypothetical protein Q9164_003845 [Protoblastenia rupestris]